MLEENISNLNQRLSGGVAPAMATPIDRATGQVAFDVIRPLVEFLIARDVSGLFVGGTTGEGILLESDERRRLHEAVVAVVDGRVPVLIHVGSLKTRTSAELAHHAASVGADAIAAVTPIFYGVHDDAQTGYYHAIAGAAPELPLFAYDIPHMAVNGVSPALARRMFAEMPSLAGMKSSNTDAQAIRALLDVVPDGRILLAGNEKIALGSLALGAAGMISGLSTAVPEPFVAMLSAFNAGNMEEAREMQRLINRLLATIPAGARIGTLKAILEARDIPVGPPLTPLPEGSPDTWAEMQEILNG